MDKWIMALLGALAGVMLQLAVHPVEAQQKPFYIYESGGNCIYVAGSPSVGMAIAVVYDAPPKGC